MKSAVLSAIREGNKTLYSMVVAQAQKIELVGDLMVFTFAPQHKTLAAQLEPKRAWIEHLAQQSAGRKIKVAAKEGEPLAPAPAADPARSAKAADLKARAKAEPVVQSVLDVFGGEIEDVEEID